MAQSTLAQLSTVVLVALALATCCCCHRTPAPYHHFFYPPQRGYVQQVPTPLRLPPFQAAPAAPAVTQTVYVVVEDAGADAEDAEEERRLLDAIPSLLEMLSTGGGFGGSSNSGPQPPPFKATKTVFLDDVEPDFDKNAWHQGEGEAASGDDARDAAPAAPAPVSEDTPTGDDSTPASPLEYSDESFDTPLDYPIDVRSGFTGAKSRPRPRQNPPVSNS